MCRSIHDGGQRCAADTRPAYRNATPGTSQWDEAAAHYASTPSGRTELQHDLNVINQAHPPTGENIAHAVALSAALQRGQDLTHAANEARVTTKIHHTRTEAPRFTPPTVTFDEVYHVGSLNFEERKNGSYEGSGMSVSVNPDDWARIARLGNDTTWTFTKPDGTPLRFAEWHDLPETDRTALRDWASANGWITQQTVHRVTWYDDEYDDTISMDFADEDEARMEAEDRADNDDDLPLERVVVWRPTDQFPETRITSDTDPSDLLLAIWVRDHRPDLDGVWWNDNYDPALLSCPRGVLVRDLDHYTRTPTVNP